MRPITDLNQESTKESELAKKLWDAAERAKSVEKITEEQVFHLSQEETKKCRYQIIDQTNRMAECVVHSGNFSHGVRLHPPHLYDLREGRVYYKEGKKWVQWTPNLKENLTRLPSRT